MKFSVLIAVYKKEQPENLRQSLKSIFRQELPPDEVVLVEDGPLTAELEQIVDDMAHKHPQLKVIRLEENRGLGIALSEGLQHCSHELVARMDSDDICMPKRFKREVDYMEAHPETDVVGSWVDEFLGSSENLISVRKVPESHQELQRFSHYRNPMNHPTVMFRKDAVVAAGGYRHCPLFEDYDLWARMMTRGCQFHNLQESLLLFRLTSQPFSQRGGIRYIRQEVSFWRRLHTSGYISFGRMVLNIIIRTLVRITPKMWRKYSYLFFLRK